MRIGIYNRHLTGVGGGEKHMLAMAEILSRRYPVDVLTHRVFDLQAAGAQLGVDLSQVRLRPVEDRPEPELAPLTADYDLFVNASDGTFLPARAPRSILLVYFPTPLDPTPWVRVKWRVGRWLRRLLLVPRYVAGFYGPERFGALTVRWARNRAQLEIPVPTAARSLRLRLLLTSQQDVRAVRFIVGGQQVAECHVPAGRVTPLEIALPVDGRGSVALDVVSRAGRGVDVRRSSSHEVQRPLGVGLAGVQVDALRYRVYQLVFQRWFRGLGQRLDSLYPALDLSHLDTYDIICANSEYTRRWVHRYWARDSVVFYPPVDVELFRPCPKRRQILSVGRFFTVGHNKKHLAMIRAFRQLVEDGLSGWELHLVGGTSLGADNADYLARVRDEATGAPIRVHTDVAFETLRRLYGESAIYWHAAGYGEDPERQPVRYEHFGLTTVEAMSAGAVPVVIDGGGQPEIVSHGVDGFLWGSIDELKALTGRLVRDGELRQRMSVAARDRSRAFGRDAFEVALWQLVESLGVSRR